MQRRPAGGPRGSSAPLRSGGSEASCSPAAHPPTPGERSWALAADTLHSLPSPRTARRRGELRAKWRGAVSGHAAPGCAPYLFQVALAQARRCCVPRSSVPAAPGSLLPRSLRLGELMNFNLRRVLMLTPAHTRPRVPYDDSRRLAASPATPWGPARVLRPRPGQHSQRGAL